TSRRGLMRIIACAAVAVALAGCAGTSEMGGGRYAVSANDNKLVLDNGVAKVPPNPAPDTVAIIDLRATPPAVVAEIEAPATVVGPPTAVAITPDESIALVTSAMKILASHPTTQVPDNRMSAVDPTG